MRIFRDIPPGDRNVSIWGGVAAMVRRARERGHYFLEPLLPQEGVAAMARRARERGLLSAQWSLAELQPDNDDFLWLCEWARQLSEQTVRLWLQSRSWFTVESEDFSYSAAIGCLLLMFAAEIARREAGEGRLWAAVQCGRFDEATERALFVQGHPTQPHKDVLEAAARRDWRMASGPP